MTSWVAFSALAKAQYLEISTFFQGYLLHTQGDRMLMAHSIEGRFPYVDVRLAELAARLPDSLRLRGLQEKYALRKAVEKVLPDAIRLRPKVPYRAPIRDVFFGSTSSPSTTTCPLVGVRMQPRIERKVVFPEPLGPSSATNSPGSISSETSSTAGLAAPG